MAQKLVQIEARFWLDFNEISAVRMAQGDNQIDIYLKGVERPFIVGYSEDLVNELSGLLKGV